MTQVALTKIVATIGPATSSTEQIERLIDSGVSVFRMNFSHGSHADHRMVYERIRTVSASMAKPIAILQDLQGPKLRVGDLRSGGPIHLTEGDEVRICTREVIGDVERFSTSYADFGKDVSEGDQILLDDGNLELKALRIEHNTPYSDEVVATVIHGGPLKPQKGINLPGTLISAPSMTPKDLDDLRFGIGLGVDMIALSFVRSASDMHDAHARIRDLGGSQPLIAKIEKPQAVSQLEEIVRASDGVMVARGDLGVEMSPESVPLIQKRLIRLANSVGIPVITATQMLESMIEAPRPTRAEVSDVANAVFDGSDAVMLSGETAVGKYPIEAVGIMRRIARTIESDPTWVEQLRHEAPDAPISRDAVAAAQAAAKLAENIGATAIAVLTESGHTARRVSQARPGVPIVAITEHDSVARRLSLWHGVVPVVDPLDGSIEEIVRSVENHVRAQEIAKSGETIVVVGAVPRSNGQEAVFLEIHHLD